MQTRGQAAVETATARHTDRPPATEHEAPIMQALNVRADRAFPWNDLGDGKREKFPARPGDGTTAMTEQTTAQEGVANRPLPRDSRRGPLITAP